MRYRRKKHILLLVVIFIFVYMVTVTVVAVKSSIHNNELLTMEDMTVIDRVDSNTINLELELQKINEELSGLNVEHTTNVELNTADLIQQIEALNDSMKSLIEYVLILGEMEGTE